jgi:two-component system, OmpR family, sensor histidine kinase ChvG
MLSKPCMASDTDTARPEPRRVRRWLGGSKLGRLIVALNLLGLAILIAGALILNEFRRGLVQARIDSLTTQGELIANVIGGAATVGSPEPMLEADKASEILQLLFIPKGQRARLFDRQGNLLADSYLVADRVEWKPLPPARKRGGLVLRWRMRDADALDPQTVQEARAALAHEVRAALNGDPVADVRRAQNGERVVSVSIPVQRVQAVLGVLTLEASDVDSTIAAQRKALTPFILVAVGVTLLSSLLLTWLVAQPILRLARAADRVRLSRARSISLPDLARREDEIGDLTRALQEMTDAQSERMDAIESFAADVAHEIRNPLTSIRSAVETLGLVTDPAARARLEAILQQDVGRLDRLITDISNASRLDAELSREPTRAVDLNRLLGDIVAMYQATSKPDQAGVRFSEPDDLESIEVMGRESPLSQVFRNLVDNARSFSPPDGAVTVALRREGGRALVSVEDTGPGIPQENLETVFERFYTARPKGAAFGGHSGLGLSIARQIVDAHNGRIWAENVMDKDGHPIGARFSVSLPEARL